jgi:hypothetical protein
MWRRTFVFVAALSLVLCVATAALWVRSYFVFDAVAGCVSETSTAETCIQVLSNRGEISLRRFDLTLTSAAPPPPAYRLRDGLRFDAGQERHWTRGDPFPWDRFRHLLGFGSHDGTYRRRPLPNLTMVERDHGITLPHWLPMFLAAVAPALLWWRRSGRPRARRRAGRCPACGYDLRGTPDRCPECGAVPGHAPATTA